MRRKAKIIRFPGSPPPPTDGASGEAGYERGLVSVYRCDQPEAMVVNARAWEAIGATHQSGAVQPSCSATS